MRSIRGHLMLLYFMTKKTMSPQQYGMGRCHEHTSKLGEWRLMQQQIELVEKAGFGYLRRFPSISLDNPLISALVERWRKETNTFHLRIGEMTITLEDVALLLGLAIDGEPVLGVTYTSCKSVCEKFLGKVPDAGYMSGGMVKLSWLKEYFSQCPDDAPMEEIERHTRAYLLYLVGSTIFSTTTGNKVPIMYLPLFENFENAGKYAWGAAALAFLYRALGRASLKSQSTISGCLTLLQCWSYFHLNIGRPNFYQEPVRDCFPFVHWWKGKQSAATVKHDIIFYRKVLDSLKPCDVEWLPYNNLDSKLIPKNIASSLILGRSKTMLICFDKAERHLPDRCLRQHGMLQGIPKDVEHWERKSRGVDSGVDLSGKMESEVSEWSARKLHIMQYDGGVDESEYMHWYSRITRKFVGRPVSPLPQFQRAVKFRTKKKRMNAGLRDIAHIADTFLTQGLDPMQIESITRIRSIAHDCLGDHVTGETVVSVNTQRVDHVEGTAIVASPSQKEDYVGDATMVAAAIAEKEDHGEGATIVVVPSQNELGKRKREKERVRRNTKGKRKRKDDSIQYYTAREGEPIQFYATPFRGDPVHLCCHCRVISHIDHSSIKFGKRVKKKDKARKKLSKKTNRKHKRKDDGAQCDAAGEDAQSPFDSVATKDNQIQLSPANIKDDELEVVFAAGEDEGLLPHHAGADFDFSQTSHAAVEGERSEAQHATSEGKTAEMSNAANMVIDPNSSDVAHEINDLNLSPAAGESFPQTAKVEGVVVPGSSAESEKDAAQHNDIGIEVLTEGVIMNE
ncbi:protein MAIN-LIKE 2-like isoform X2 [Manihot esculenta]|uniref:protein MAIN-LIKE 2-like isoform X2 n=1 Tax=Manihot esculenta TaxID=3983 RepID=UPI000B5D6709|nr:protein MAIN-LIKE 2-like isoform X2 [Manihot esculenta]XP_021593154.1 protein MAIN-LIKE 2-like isoform X2 [Manihot esculenta]XP_043813908.1 protein MAIN-LIKE 2-like isoform X2 [Manihot esculenta]